MNIPNLIDYIDEAHNRLIGMKIEELDSQDLYDLSHQAEDLARTADELISKIEELE